MPHYPNASTEPLEVIRMNECEARLDLATSRFQALWNEIERLREELATSQSLVRGYVGLLRSEVEASAPEQKAP